MYQLSSRPVEFRRPADVSFLMFRLFPKKDQSVTAFGRNFISHESASQKTKNKCNKSENKIVYFSLGVMVRVLHHNMDLAGVDHLLSRYGRPTMTWSVSYLILSDG